VNRGGKIIGGQNVRSEKLSFAKRLRREMTPAERALWRALRRNALDGLHFRRQQVIEGFIVDFYCDAVKLAIEVDGKPHEEQGEYDELRAEAIARQGVRIIRIPNEALHDIEAVIEHIKEKIAELLGEAGKPNP
jgi:very-short-patch-repair endonuclease